jgi:TRAP-type uncharacterized transport system fused permease subunit
MFFYNGAILMDGTWPEIIRAGVTAIFGVFLLSSGVQGWFVGSRVAWFMRLGLILAALCMIAGGLISDLVGIGAAIVLFFVQRTFKPAADAQITVSGSD